MVLESGDLSSIGGEELVEEMAKGRFVHEARLEKKMGGRDFYMVFIFVCTLWRNFIFFIVFVALDKI